MEVRVIEHVEAKLGPIRLVDFQQLALEVALQGLQMRSVSLEALPLGHRFGEVLNRGAEEHVHSRLRLEDCVSELRRIQFLQKASDYKIHRSRHGLPT